MGNAVDRTLPHRSVAGSNGNRGQLGRDRRPRLDGLRKVIQQERLLGTVDAPGHAKSATQAVFHGISGALARIAEVLHEEGEHQPALRNQLGRNLFDVQHLLRDVVVRVEHFPVQPRRPQRLFEDIGWFDFASS